MNYIDEEYIINEEGMIVEEIEKQDDHKLNNKADPQDKDLTKRIYDQIQRAPSDQASEILGFDEKLRMRVKLADSDRLGCLLNELNLEQTQGHLVPDPGQIERQISYLGEKLKVIESEDNEGRTILRSYPPRVDGEVISFFEMAINRSKGLSLARYKYDPNIGKRVSVSAPLSRDTLERLISDLIEL